MNRQLYVGKLPNRRKPCLYVVEGNKIKILAYFVDYDAVIEFIKYYTGEMKDE